MHAFFRAVLEEARAVVKSPALFLTAVVMPIFWVVVLACIFSEGLMRNLPVGLVDQDNSAQSRQMVENLDAVPSVDFIGYPSVAAAQDDLAAGKIYGLMVFPNDWSSKSAGSRTDSAIELYLNRTYYAIAVTLETDIKTALASIAQERLLAQAAKTGGGLHGAKERFSVISADVLISGNPAINFQAYLLATLIPGVLALACILTCVGRLTREWRNKTTASLLEKGNLRLTLCARLVFWTLLYSLYLVGYVAWFAGWQGWAPVGSVAVWCLGAVLLAAAMAACALLFTSLAPSWIIAMSAAICYIAPTFPFTGFSYPIESMDGAAQVFCQIFPLTWFLRLQSSQWVLGSGASHTLYLLCIMALFVLVPALLGSLLVKRRFAAMAHKEAQQHPIHDIQNTGFWATALEVIKRGALNPDTFAIFVGATAFYLVFYAWPYSNQQITSVPTAVVDLDRTAASRAIIERIHSLTMIKVLEQTADSATAKDLYQREVVDAVITIPQNFEADLLASKHTSLRLTANGAFPVKARAAMASLAGVVRELTVKESALALVRAGAPTSEIKFLSHTPVSLAEQSLFNTLSGYASYIVPVVMPVIIQAVLLMALAMTLGGWLSRNAPEKLMMTILSTPKGVLSFFTGFWIFGFVWMLYALGVDFSLFDYRSMANPAAALLIGALFVGAVVWMGCAATLLLNSNAYAAQALVLISAPCVFLTGAVFPSSHFLLPADIVAALLPTTPGVNAMVGAAQNGASLSVLMPQIAHLIVLNVLYGALTFYLANRRAQERRLIAIKSA